MSTTQLTLKDNFLLKLIKFFATTKFLIIFFGTLFLITGGLFLSPKINEFAYQINAPKATKYEYPVSNPKLLVPNSDSIDKSGFLNEVKSNISSKALPSQNRLVIPKVGVDSPILEGSSLSILDNQEGVWREPFTGNPNEPGNMVIAGHRFQYLPPNFVTFYHLNKLQTGDKILVYWKDESGQMKDFVYEIYETAVVLPSDTFVRDHNQKNSREITLYTCGPEVGENDKRLIVKAKEIT